MVFILSIGFVSAQDTDRTDDSLDLNVESFAELQIADDGNSVPENGSEDLNHANISAEDVEKYYGGPERFAVNLMDDEGNPIANGNVTITINGQVYERTTNSHGSASIGINLPADVYNATVEYKGMTCSSKITVRPTLQGNDLTKIYGNSTQYYIRALDINGKPLNGQQVEFNINGVFYKRSINESGIARMNINLAPGTYIITAKNPVSNETYSNNITVLTSIVENHNITKYYKNQTQFSLIVLDGEGNPAGAGENVTFNINGVFYTRYSNSSGQVKLNINLDPGDYIITSDYNGLKVSNSIRVLSILEANDLNMDYMDGSRYEVKLLDGEGNPYPNQNITLNINGVFYQRTTDSQGIARLNIRLNCGTYIITASYNGLNVANNIMIDNPLRSYDLGNGHRLELPKSAVVQENEGTYNIAYNNTNAYLYFYAFNDENLDMFDYYIMKYDFNNAETLGDYNGWDVFRLLMFEEDEYELTNRIDKNIYQINSDDLDAAKFVADSLK